MIDRKEYLMLCLAEELGECQKEILKCLRFGLHNSPDNLQTNYERFLAEWSDLFGVVETLDKEGFEIFTTEEGINAKKERIELYFEKSKALGVVG